MASVPNPTSNEQSQEEIFRIIMTDYLIVSQDFITDVLHKSRCRNMRTTIYKSEDVWQSMKCEIEKREDPSDYLIMYHDVLHFVKADKFHDHNGEEDINWA